MTISQLPDADLIKTFKYICNLCGYPEVGHEKLPVLIDFLRLNHGHNTTDELTDAYRALASARLEEKVDNFKSLNGMAASRVLQAYMRSRKKDTSFQTNDKGRLSDDNRELIHSYNGETVMFNHEVTPDMRKMLMRHWIQRQKENYMEIKRADLLTATSFDFLMEEGTVRISGEMFQVFTDNTYKDICPWEEIERLGKRLVATEEMQINKNRSTGFRRMLSPSAGGSQKDGIKRMAVAVYFDHT